MIDKIIVTSGPTKEWIDPVRYISNASSGRMGYSIASECNKLTNNLVYIAGGTDSDFKKVTKAKNISVDTTQEMLEAVLEELQEGALLIMSAAPSDYRPIKASEQKIKKKDSTHNAVLNLELVENPDILKKVAEYIQEKNWKNIARIGFSAETHDLQSNAIGKLKKKDLDWILGNSVGKGIGFGGVENTLHCYSRRGDSFTIGPMDKTSLAKEVVKLIVLPMIESKQQL